MSGVQKIGDIEVVTLGDATATVGVLPHKVQTVIDFLDSRPTKVYPNTMTLAVSMNTCFNTLSKVASHPALGRYRTKATGKHNAVAWGTPDALKQYEAYIKEARKR